MTTSYKSQAHLRVKARGKDVAQMIRKQEDQQLNSELSFQQFARLRFFAQQPNSIITPVWASQSNLAGLLWKASLSWCESEAAAATEKLKAIKCIDKLSLQSSSTKGAINNKWDCNNVFVILSYVIVL